MFIVLAGDEPVENNNLCYVGTNYYEFGVQAGKTNITGRERR